MTVLKSIYADLVEKRLWPVAIALVVAIIVVPLLLGRGGREEADVPTTAAVPPLVRGSADDDARVAAQRAEVGVETAPVKPTKRLGAQHDPFAGTQTRATATTPAARESSASSASPGGGQASKAVDSASGAAASATGDGAAGSGGGATGASTDASAAASSSTTPAPSKPAATTSTATSPATVVPPALRTLQVTLGVAPTAGARIDRRPGSLRLAPLPSAADPVVLFLGMLEHTPAAVFMLPDGATANGEGRCVPRPGDCQTLELPVGGESYVDVPTASGGSRELRLTVPATKVASWSRLKVADAVRERVSKAGLALVRAAIGRQDPALSYYRFSKRTGLLVRHKQPPAG